MNNVIHKVKYRNGIRALSVLLAFVILSVSLGSCKMPNFPDDYTQSGGTDKLKYVLTESEIEALNKKIDNLYSIVDGDKGVDALYEELDTIQSGIDYVYTQSGIAYVLYCVYGNDEKYLTMRSYSSETYSQLLKEVYAAYKYIYDSPYRDAFYEEWPDEEIEYMLLYSNSINDEYVALNSEYNRIVEDSRRLDIQDEDYFKKSAELYKSAVKVNQKIAECFGYDNYLEYAYEQEYMRDYSVDDINKIYQFAEDYIMPLYEATSNAYIADEADATDILKNEAFLYCNASFTSKNIQSGIKKFAKSTNMLMYGYYHDLMESENYYKIDDNSEYSSYDGAFTVYLPSLRKSTMYFGENYRDAMTFIHEFGHYVAGAVNYKMNPTLDICELQSQGAEFLFLAFLKDIIKNDNAYTLFVESYLSAALQSIIQCLIINEFEEKVYGMSADELDACDLDAVYNDICSRYDKSDTEFEGLFDYDMNLYWRRVTIEAPGYYISYAMSLLPSLELFAVASVEYQKAADMYTAVQYCVSPYFSELMDIAGFTSPFDEKLYEDISEYFMSIISADNKNNDMLETAG